MFGGYSGGSSTFTGKSSSGDGGNNFDLTGTTFCGDDLACYRDVIVNNVTKTSNDEITISLQYKSSQDLVGYQFVLAFDTSVVNPTAGATFTFTETTAAVNFLISEQLYDSGKFVILGSLTNLSNQIPSSSVATNFLDITINETGVFTAIEADIEDATSILKSNNNQNTLESPNPVFAYWNSTTSTEVKNNFWTGSGTGGSVPDPTGGSNIRLLIKELYGTPSIFDKDWAKELDTRLKGWYDVTDLCSIVIYALDTSITNLLVDYVCEEEMISSADCDGCDCPDELISLDNEECKSEVFISDTTITSLKDGSPAAIITLSYRSSCCIDGYDVILGNFKDRDGYDSTGGILEILNTQDQEPVQREWMEDVGFDPSLTFSEYYTNLTEQTLVYPRAFGFSFGNALNALAQSSDKNYGASERTGAWCIPSTNGGAKVLTRLLVNLDSFNGLPTIESFRLVTNEELVAPINDYGNNWTGIDLNESLGSDPLHTTVRYEDLQACLYYLKQGWGGSESGYPLNQSNAQIQSFISETGKTELDIADVLAVANHIVIEGNNQASNPAALIVPKDCCSCVLPSDFTVTTTYKNCLDPDNPGTILVEFDASSDADGYKVYRRSKKVINSTPSDFAVSRKLYENGNLTQEELLFTEFELIDVRTGISDGGTPSTNPIYDKPKLPPGCCDEVHTVEYVVVAFNKCGEISKQSTIENFQCCDETPASTCSFWNLY
jgi:hypothetical protein